MKDFATIENIVATGKQVEDDFWSKFTPATVEDIERIEASLNIKLPEDFAQFYLQVGWGQAPCGISIFDPDEIISECSVPIYYVTGSLFAGDMWASLEEHDRLWLSSGEHNPNPSRFTDEATDLGGVKLWDLLMVGSDMCCGYFTIYVGRLRGAFQYCMIHSSNLLYTAPSFLDGFLRGLHEELESIAECE